MTAGPRQLAVFDVDGVLADVTHRIHHLEGARKDWAAFFRAAADDPSLRAGIDLAMEVLVEHDLAYLTGRPEHLRRTTITWLSQHGLPNGRLWMRGAADRRPAAVMKLEALAALGGPTVVAVLVDDDERVVAAAQEAGYAVLHATWAPGGGRRTGSLARAQDEQGRT